MAEDEMVGWHHQLNGHGFEQALAAGDGQGGLACCSSWGHKESDTTEQLKQTDAHIKVPFFSYSIHHLPRQIFFVKIKPFMCIVRKEISSQGDSK